MQGAQTGISGVNAATSAGQYGLQGLNTSGQAASTLGNLGQIQFDQENAINQNMLSAGTQQQQLQQQGLNTAYNNYQTQLNYPYQQLAFMQGMYQGLPLSQSASNMYQAAPSLGSTALGLGTAGIGAAKLMGRKGGATKDFEVRKMASGGIASGVPAAKLDSMLGRLDDQQLVQKTDPKLNDPQTAQAAQSEMNFRQQMRNPGIGAAPATNMNNLAGGGIVAFADAGQVKEEPPEETSKAPEAGQKVTLDQILSGGPTKEALQTSAANIKDIVGENTAGKGLLDYLERRQAEGAGDKEKQSAMRFIQAGLGMMGGTSPYAAVNIGQGAAPAVQGAIQDAQEQHKEELASAKAKFDVENTSYQDKLNIAKMAKEDLQKTREALTHIYGYQSAADSAIKAAGINANSHVSVAKYNADKAETLEIARATNQENLEKLRKSGDMGHIMYTNILGKMTNGNPDKATWEQKAEASTQAVNAMHPSYGPQQQNADITLATKRDQSINSELIKNGLFMLSSDASDKDKEKRKAIIDEAGAKFDAQFNGNKQNLGKGTDTPTANGLPPIITKDNVTYVLQPNGNYVVK
jgi:hypothetical protein